MKNLTKNKGVMLVLSSPSGAGKSSICKSLINLDKNLSLSVSTTTRDKRVNEKSGKDYSFVSIDKFKDMLDKGYFLEHAYVFGNYYGTSKSLVEKNLGKILSSVSNKLDYLIAGEKPITKKNNLAKQLNI